MKILYVVGCTHTGSTLLSRILDQHSRVFAAGELQYLDVYWGPTGRRCSCGLHALRCPVWGEAFWRLVGKDLRRPQLARVSPERSMEWRRAISGWLSARGKSRFVRQNRQLFETLAAVTGAEVIVDSSKSVWRLLPLWRGLPADVVALHLIRSPEGQVSSRMGRTVRSFWRAAFGEYLRVNANVRWFFADPVRYRKVRYEDLVDRPEETVRGIFEWLGLAWEDPFAIEPAPAHDLGGNPRTKVSASLRPDPARALPDRSFTSGQRLVLACLRRFY